MPIEAARALFAFWGREMDADGGFATDATELGALMTAQFQEAVIDIRDMMQAYFEERAKATQKPRGSRRG